MEFNKKGFLEMYLLKQRELSRRQREYKTILSTKLRTRKETIVESSYQATIDQLLLEKNTLRAQIWTADGETHRNDNARYLRNIRCHVQCQEQLANDIRQYKIDICNLQREISRVTKQVYDLNRRTVPDTQHQEFVARARKKMIILENQLEVGVRRECGFTAVNADLRYEIVKMLNIRTCFNELYTKMVQKLNSDKKYLVDLIEYALSQFDQCIEVYEKLDGLNKRDRKELELKKIEMQTLQRRLAAEEEDFAFLECKGKHREMDDLQPKEYRRREEFRRKHNRKINLYNDILDKILEYTESEDVSSVIAKFQQQESAYYSYFNYANEMSYHMTLLNNSVNRLFREITDLKTDNHNTLSTQLETIQKLEASLHDKRKANTELVEVRERNDERLEKLMQGITMIRDQSRADCSSLSALLGNYKEIDLVNMRKFLKILERRIFDLTAATYIVERHDDMRSTHDSFVVKDIDKTCDWPTNLDDIVLTQQCPECAEGDAFNVDDADGGISVHATDIIKKRLYEKVAQPEMQYRLHSISQCRLPRSRLLAAKRNI